MDRSGSVRVFILKHDTLSPTKEDFYWGDTVACDTHYNRWVLLFDWGSSSSTVNWQQVLAVRGHLLAYAITGGQSNGPGPITAFEVLNLRTGRTISNVNVAAPATDSNGLYANFRALLTRGGALAFATVNPSVSQPYVAVVQSSTVAYPTVIDQGSEIDVQSLRLSGNSVFWNHGTEARSYALSIR